MDWMLVIVAVLVCQAVGLSGAWLALFIGLRAMSVLTVKYSGAEDHGAGRLS
jgi:hypothetical protein